MWFSTPLEGDVTGQALSSLASFGRLVHLGYSAGTTLRIDSLDLIWKPSTIIGFNTLLVPSERSARNLDEVVDLSARGGTGRRWAGRFLRLRRRKRLGIWTREVRSERSFLPFDTSEATPGNSAASGHADRSAGRGEPADGQRRSDARARSDFRSRFRAAAPAGLLGIHLNYPASVPPEIDRAIYTPGEEGTGRGAENGRSVNGAFMQPMLVVCRRTVAPRARPDERRLCRISRVEPRPGPPVPQQ